MSHPKNKNLPRKQNILLIGFMGSGKTSIGKRLSYRLQRPVEDTDKLIELREGMSVSEIFQVHGEKAFRQMETELLREIRDAGTSPRIYSLGGGTPVQLQNQPLIRQCGTVIYLRARPETIYERLKGDSTRPLLQCADPPARIRELLAQREPAYARCADFILDVDGKEHGEVLEEIEVLLEKNGTFAERRDPFEEA